MRTTDFEKVFLNNKSNTLSPKLFHLFHQLLQKVNNDNEIRRWTHDLLRNYVDAFYWYTKREINRCSGPGGVNIYEDKDSQIFYTGLSTNKDNEKLFIVKQSSDEEWHICSESEEACLKSVRTSNECPDFMKEKNVKLEVGTLKIIENLSDFNQAKNYTGWQHMIVDGIDNFPQTFIRGLFNIPQYMNIDDVRVRQQILLDSFLRKDDSFSVFQDILLEAINDAIKKIEDKKQKYPHSIYKTKDNKKAKTGQDIIQVYKNILLPIYLMNDSKPDFCVVWAEQGVKGHYKYQAMTILNMDEVYKDMRVLGVDYVKKYKDWWVD